MYLTDKQIEILTILHKGNNEGEPVDLDDLLKKLSYKPSKESMQFSIRALIGKELIEKAGLIKRRNRRRVTYQLTDLGKHYIVGIALTRPPEKHVSVDEEQDKLELEFESWGDLGPPLHSHSI